MNSIGNWFQDWSDACEYAKECVPDLSFAAPQEPYSALVSIALGCFLMWAWNERKLQQSPRLAAQPAAAIGDVHAIHDGRLRAMIDRAKTVSPHLVEESRLIGFSSTLKKLPLFRSENPSFDARPAQCGPKKPASKLGRA